MSAYEPNVVVPPFLSSKEIREFAEMVIAHHTVHDFTGDTISAETQKKIYCLAMAWYSTIYGTNTEANEEIHRIQNEAMK